MYKFIDLFAGIGGFHLALKTIAGGGGANCLLASEIDPNAQKTYALNFPNTKILEDIIKIPSESIPQHDILCAGFPCQAFSIAGNQRGFKDIRGVLFFEVVRIAQYHKPSVLFLENVKNLRNHNNGETLRIIVESLNHLGYAVYYNILNSCIHANVPQNRERIFIIGFLKDKVRNHAQFIFPKTVKLTRTIFDCLDNQKQDDCFYYMQTSKYYQILQNNIKKTDTLYQLRRIYVRENKSNLCPTLTANMGTGGHNVPIVKDKFGIRKLTPRECFNFQGFPAHFKLPNIANSKLYQQAGNSVTYPLIKKIFNEIIKVL